MGRLRRQRRWNDLKVPGILCFHFSVQYITFTQKRLLFPHLRHLRLFPSNVPACMAACLNRVSFSTDIAAFLGCLMRCIDL